MSPEINSEFNSEINPEAISETDSELMSRYGIVEVPADYFLYRQYRYTQLKDAIAQAERDRVMESRPDAKWLC